MFPHRLGYDESVTYWKFHLVLMVPAIAVLLYLARRTKPAVFRRVVTGFAIVIIAALIYTAPWDSYLISRGVWTYTSNHVTLALRICHVPLEEYCFFILPTDPHWSHPSLLYKFESKRDGEVATFPLTKVGTSNLGRSFRFARRSNRHGVFFHFPARPLFRFNSDLGLSDNCLSLVLRW